MHDKTILCVNGKAGGSKVVRDYEAKYVNRHGKINKYLVAKSRQNVTY